MKKSQCCHAEVEIVSLGHRLGDTDGKGDENRCICTDCKQECETYNDTEVETPFGEMLDGGMEIEEVNHVE